MINLLEKYPVLSIVIITFLMLLPNLNLIDVSIMEARNFITAREMLTDNHWLLTTMNGEARYEKPPLPTWLTAAFASLFGIKNVFGYRFPAVLMVAVLGIFIYLLSLKLLKNKIHSFYNGLIALTSFYIIGIIFEAPWDIYAHGFMLMAIHYLFQYFDNKVNFLPAALFFAASFLSKGPISFYALFLPFLFSYGLTYKLSKKKIIKMFLSFVIGIAIGAIWFIYIRYADKSTFLETTSRETSNWSSYNVKPFYFYWNFFIQSGLWSILAFISLFYPYLKSKVSNPKAYKFSFLWTIIAMILLSLIPEKKPRYLMPVLIPLAINIGFYFEYLITAFKKAKFKTEALPVFFNFGILALAGICFPILGFSIFKELISEKLLAFIFVSIVLILLGLFIVINLIKKQLKQVFYLSIFLYVSIFAFVPSIVKKQISESNSSLEKLNIKSNEQGLKIYSYNLTPEFIWYFGSKIPPIKQENIKQDKMGILTKDITIKELAFLKENFVIDSIMRFNLNKPILNSSKEKKRLITNYYVLTRIK